MDIRADELAAAYPQGDATGLTAEEIIREGAPQAPPAIPLAAAAQIIQDLGVCGLSF